MFKYMQVGTKSVLFGVHQFLWHPITVLLAWRKLYREWPHWPELIAIFLHDAPGYWGKPNMDGPEGKQHPYAGALLTARLVVLLKHGYWLKGVPEQGCEGYLIYWRTACHSRDVARRHNKPPTMLSHADKASILFDPAWWYIFRARLSGEIREYKARDIEAGRIHVDATDREWYSYYRNKVINELKGLL